MKFVLCSSWSLLVQPRGIRSPLCSVLWAAGAPQAPGTTCWGPFAACGEQEGRSCPAISQCPPHHEQSGGKQQRALLTSPSAMQELWKEPFPQVSGRAGGGDRPLCLHGQYFLRQTRDKLLNQEGQLRRALGCWGCWSPCPAPADLTPRQNLGRSGGQKLLGSAAQKICAL